jgi:uncharacterized protein YndB with AHSA1/START domain
MSSVEQIIEKRIVVHAKAETVYRALTEGRALARWFANRAESKPVPGGSLLLMWGAGEQTEGARAVFSRLVPGREVALQWVSKIKPGETIAVNGLHESTFTISPSPEGVIVAMRYTADPPPADSERMKMDQDWDQALVSLKSLCEGPDAPLGDEARAAMERRASAAAGAGAEPIEAVHVVATPRRAAARPKAGGKKKPAKKAKTARKSTKKRAKVAKKAKTKAKAKGKKAARRPAKKSAARPARKAAKKKAGSAKRARSSARKPARKKPAKKR